MKINNLNLLFSIQEHAKHEYIKHKKTGDINALFKVFNELDLAEKVLK